VGDHFEGGPSGCTGRPTECSGSETSDKMASRSMFWQLGQRSCGPGGLTLFPRAGVIDLASHDSSMTSKSTLLTWMDDVVPAFGNGCDFSESIMN
jgi:hypothetical protein